VTLIRKYTQITVNLRQCAERLTEVILRYFAVIGVIRGSVHFSFFRVGLYPTTIPAETRNRFYN
jgi:hypothetical protein